MESTIIDKIRKIKYGRLNGNEICLINTIEGAIKEVEEDKITWYSKDHNKILFEMRPHKTITSKFYLIANYNNILMFYNEFMGLSDNYIRTLILKIVPEYLI